MKEEVENLHKYLDKLSEKYNLKSVKIIHDKTTMKIEWNETKSYG